MACPTARKPSRVGLNRFGRLAKGCAFANLGEGEEFCRIVRKTVLPDLTPAVARALEAAQRHARVRGGADVQPLDLLHGLLEEEEGRAAVLAIGAGLDHAAYRRAVGTPPAPPPGSPDLDLHPDTHAALQQAGTLARDLSGEHAIVSEALLLALLRSGDGPRGALEPHGLRAARLEADLIARGPAPVPLEEPLRLGDTTEQADLARVLDAGANRAREALRVLEDHARFALDDAYLTAELKRLRHDLTAALCEHAPHLLEARDTRGDVGTTLSTEAERRRASLGEVLRANAQRLQEALRSLEEFGKVQDVRLGEAVERLRYRSYQLEQALLLGTDARRRLEGARLYVLLTGATCAAALDWTIAEAAAGGAHAIQLREKGLSDRELLKRARQVRRWTQKAGLLFIVNDRPDIARLAGADGVHLGQDDLPVREARRILGPDALIGVSTHSVEQLRQAVLDGASYVGVGPTFPSSTKDFAELSGLEFVRRAAAETSLPAFVIGGVNLETIGSAVAAGARRVAVSAAVAAADEPRVAAAALLAALDEGA
jgi:thiamine-phosphate pyrophosphorylase